MVKLIGPALANCVGSWHRRARRVVEVMVVLAVCLSRGPLAHSDPSKPAATANAETPVDPQNGVRPASDSADLQQRAEHLLQAIAKLEPKLADDFFFPRAPFIPLKDVADPGRYFDQLLSTYHRDIRELHATRRDWQGAAFVSFTLGSEPRWVAPGKEYNKIGYYRTFHGKLRYRMGPEGTRTYDLDVGTVISWDGHWYVTHLAALHHAAPATSSGTRRDLSGPAGAPGSSQP
jgi:hypothetical protein